MSVFFYSVNHHHGLSRLSAMSTRAIKCFFALSLTALAFSIICLSNDAQANTSEEKSKVVIILDDLGGNAKDKYAFDLPNTVTFAILPNTRKSEEFSLRAAQQNREVMLHMPMESLRGLALGDGPLMSDMYPHEIKHALSQALKTVPHAVGVNNHMGSKLTQMTLHMQAVMQTLSEGNLFFIDSRTTRYTKASKIAKSTGVTTATRDIFLDHKRSTEFVSKQFDKLIQRARKNGKAIGIGHPYPVTVEFLKEALTNLPSDIELITVSSYLNEQDKFRYNPLLVKAQREFIEQEAQHKRAQQKRAQQKRSFDASINLDTEDTAPR